MIRRYVVLEIVELRVDVHKSEAKIKLSPISGGDGPRESSRVTRALLEDFCLRRQ
jgi:hypothetical protein